MSINTDFRNNIKLPLRYLIFHIHPVSARLRFLKLRKVHVCLPSPLPPLSKVVDAPHSYKKIAFHPCTYLPVCCEKWQLPYSALKLVNNFHLWIESPDRDIPIFLAQVKGLQIFAPPSSSEWIELPDCVPMLDVEKDIMHAVYQWLME